ncbi:hypothetical protein VTK73DRAFT_6001 [Phialemonium thermophilum]|uniref:WSC domain-containing protein n=1 Tax=Phialemonium thermophilum TaxID=223376 RepID=A0ABR3V0R8_9PEZI
MTVAKCTAACQASGYILAGVEYGGECYCGNTIANGGKPASSGCDMTCNGNQSEICGGPSRLNVYDFHMQFPTSGVPVTSTAPRNPPPSAPTSGTAARPRPPASAP